MYPYLMLEGVFFSTGFLKASGFWKQILLLCSISNEQIGAKIFVGALEAFSLFPNLKRRSRLVLVENRVGG